MSSHYNIQHHGAANPPGGFSLIEVLVTFLLVSGGLLGALAYQIKAKQIADHNLQQFQACQIAEDVASRLSRNRGALQAGAFTSLQADYRYDCSGAMENCATSASGIATDCNAAQLAQFDWHDAICQGSTNAPLHALPEAAISVHCQDSGTCDDTDSYQIALQWQSKNVFCGTDQSCLDQSQCTLDLIP